MKNIAVLTSGGDAPGMNACIRAVVRAGLRRKAGVFGVERGYQGLIDRALKPLDNFDVRGIVNMGGSILASSRSEKFRTPEGRRDAAAFLKSNDIGGLVAIGGDGTFQGARLLEDETGIKVVGCTGTIDNDLAGTDQTIGFDTAVNTALEAIDRIHDTAAAMGRLFFVEVMGRNAGDIAIYSGVAGGADVVLYPEDRTETVETICAYVTGEMKHGHRTILVVVAEGDELGGAEYLKNEVSKRTGVPAWATILGHIQRGGRPTARDRIIATLSGEAAVDALMNGRSRCMVGVRGLNPVLVPFDEALISTHRIPDPMLKLVRRTAHGG